MIELDTLTVYQLTITNMNLEDILREVKGRVSGSMGRIKRLGVLHPEHDIEKELLLHFNCYLLKQKTNIAYHVDHIFPLAKGGIHHHLNLQILDQTMNSAKNDSLTFFHPDILHWTQLDQKVLDMIDPEKLKLAYQELADNDAMRKKIAKITNKIQNMTAEELSENKVIKEYRWEKAAYPNTCNIAVRRKYLKDGLDVDSVSTCDYCGKEMFITKFGYDHTLTVKPRCYDCVNISQSEVKAAMLKKIYFS